jgi:hypothetical protein
MRSLILSLSSTWLMTIALSFAPAAHAAEPPKSNIVYILCDDLGEGRLLVIDGDPAPDDWPVFSSN